VYSELLRLALANAEPMESSMSDLVSQAVARRAAVSGGSGGAQRIGDSLAYDLALAHLCDRLGIRHDLVGELAGPEARKRAEQLVSARMPSLKSVLIGRTEIGDGLDGQG
jgi:hypothetical protein